MKTILLKVGIKSDLISNYLKSFKKQLKTIKKMINVCQINLFKHFFLLTIFRIKNSTSFLNEKKNKKRAFKKSQGQRRGTNHN